MVAAGKHKDGNVHFGDLVDQRLASAFVNSSG